MQYRTLFAVLTAVVLVIVNPIGVASAQAQGVKPVFGVYTGTLFDGRYSLTLDLRDAGGGMVWVSYQTFQISPPASSGVRTQTVSYDANGRFMVIKEDTGAMMTFYPCGTSMCGETTSWKLQATSAIIITADKRG